MPFEDSHVQKRYADCKEVEELWQWIDGPLLDAVYTHKVNNQSSLDVTGVNRPLGPLRLRQLRVKGIPCDYDDDDVCFPKYTFEEEDKKDFAGAVSGLVYEYTEEEETGTHEWTALESDVKYSAGGYVVDLPLDLTKDEARAVIERLRADRWLAEPSRALFVNLNTLNREYMMYASTQLLTEILPTGNLEQDTRLRAFRVDLYVTPTDHFRAACEVGIVFLVLLFALRCLYHIFSDIRLLRGVYPGIVFYLSNGWNVLEIVNLGTYIGTIIHRIIILTSEDRREMLDGEQVDASEYVNAEVLADRLYFANKLIAFNLLLTFFKSFKYLQLSSKLLLMWSVLAQALPDILAFMIGFLVILFGFSLMGHVTFGSELDGFRTLRRSMSTLLSLAFGESEAVYTDYRVVDSFFGPFFFYFFLAMVVVLLLNLFIAVMADAYQVVRGFESGPSSRNKLAKAIRVERYRFKHGTPLKVIVKERLAKFSMADKELADSIISSELWENLQKLPEKHKVFVSVEEFQEALGPSAKPGKARELIIDFYHERRSAKAYKFTEDGEQTSIGDALREVLDASKHHRTGISSQDDRDDVFTFLADRLDMQTRELRKVIQKAVALDQQNVATAKAARAWAKDQADGSDASSSESDSKPSGSSKSSSSSSSSSS